MSRSSTRTLVVPSNRLSLPFRRQTKAVISRTMDAMPYMGTNINLGMMKGYVTRCVLFHNSDRFSLQYIGWILNDKYSFEFSGGGMAADSIVEINARPVPQEPMVRPLFRYIPKPFFFYAFVSDSHFSYILFLCPAPIVYHRQLGYLEPIRIRRHEASRISSYNEYRLHSGLSAQGFDQHWVRSIRLPDGRLYQHVSDIDVV
jgi:hypothetical protein